MYDFTDYQVIKDMIFNEFMALQDATEYIVEDIGALIFAEKLASNIIDYINGGLSAELIERYGEPT